MFMFFSKCFILVTVCICLKCLVIVVVFFTRIDSAHPSCFRKPHVSPKEFDDADLMV